MTYEYEFPRPAVSADMVVLRRMGDELSILLIRRRNNPFQNHWALPGGFMKIDETLEQAAARELREETGLTASGCRQLGAFSTVDRDPRGRVITVAFLMTVSPEQTAVAADDATDARWFPVNNLPALAFDHDQIIAMALDAAPGGQSSK